MLREFRVSTIFCALAMTVAAAQSRPGHDRALPDAPSQRQIAEAAAPVARHSSTARANMPFQPLTPREKFDHFLHHTYSPYTFVNAAYNATYAQVLGEPWEYGGGMSGWGQRFGAAIAGTETRSFFGTFLFPTLLRQDPRYFAMYEGPKPKRALHALSRVVLVHADDGHTTLNTSGLLTIAFTEALANAWIPEDRRYPGQTFNRMLGDLQGDATTFLLREFTPDLQRLFHRLAPRKVKQIEKKIPPQITGMPPSD